MSVVYDKPIYKKIDKKLGYEYFIDKAHPLASSIGRVYFHRHVASVKLGRWLIGTEHVHHIDGNKLNNGVDNLVVLSSNTHASTHRPRELPASLFCKRCGNPFIPSKRDQSFCSSECGHINRRQLIVGEDELSRLVWEKPTSQLAREWGVSDKAIDKRCHKLGIKKPPRGYWTKKKDYHKHS